MYPNLSAPTEGLAAVCLPNKVEKCLQSQKATSRAWIGLEQNIIDTALLLSMNGKSVSLPVFA